PLSLATAPPTFDAPMTHSTTAQATAGYTPASDRDPADSGGAAKWSLAQRFGLRFAIVYVLLYTFPGPVQELPFTDWISNGLSWGWRKIVPWFGAHVLQLAKPVSTQPSGSGDKLFDWVQIVVMLTIAVIAAAVWSAADRSPRARPKMLAAFKL